MRDVLYCTSLLNRWTKLSNHLSHLNFGVCPGKDAGFLQGRSCRLFRTPATTALPKRFASVNVPDHMTTVVHSYETFSVALIAFRCEFREARFYIGDQDAFEWLTLEEMELNTGQCTGCGLLNRNVLNIAIR